MGPAGFSDCTPVVLFNAVVKLVLVFFVLVVFRHLHQQLRSSLTFAVCISC